MSLKPWARERGQGDIRAARLSGDLGGRPGGDRRSAAERRRRRGGIGDV